MTDLHNQHKNKSAKKPPNMKTRETRDNANRRPRSEKPLQTSGSRTFLSFSCFSIANQEAVSRSAALLSRIKALALQKWPLLFRDKNRRHLGCRNVMCSRGCAVQNEGIALS